MLVILLLMLWGVWGLLSGATSHPTISFGDVVNDAKAGKIDKIEVNGTNLTVTYLEVQNGSPVVKSSQVGQGSDIAKFLTDEGVALTRTGAQSGQAAVNLVFKQSGGLGGWGTLLLDIVPFALMGGFLWFLLRQSGGANSRAMGFGKSRARLFKGAAIAVTFGDVAGVDEAKAELAEVVEFLKFPEKFAKLGARIPKGVLLLGPPGTGKTLLARAVAGEAGVPFFSVSGSEFVEMFVGVGASRVRDLFEQAKKNAPCILFLDEIDAVGRQRGAGVGGGNDEREQTLNQILVEMDGFEAGVNVIVIAATNRPDILDPALLRPGRFDRKVVLDIPDVRGREAILKVHAKGKPLERDVSLEVVAKSTPGFSGADLANLVNEAAILAARRDRETISQVEFEEAVDRVIAGPERKSRLLSEHERKMTAYHEGGHAVVAHFMEHHDPPRKITIVSHGMAGGYTRFLPDEEAHYRTGSMFRDQLCGALGGYVAEEIVFGEASTGPSNDLEELTRLARSMVTRWGMSKRLGARTFGRTEELVFLGREISETRNYSEKVAEEIDDEVRALVEEATARARVVLIQHRELLDKLAKVLLESETLEGDELTRLLNSDPTEAWVPAAKKPESPPAASPGEPERQPAGVPWGPTSAPR